MLSNDEDGPAREAAQQQDEDSSLKNDPHTFQILASKGLEKTNTMIRNVTM